MLVTAGSAVGRFKILRNHHLRPVRIPHFHSQVSSPYFRESGINGIIKRIRLRGELMAFARMPALNVNVVLAQLAGLNGMSLVWKRTQHVRF